MGHYLDSYRMITGFGVGAPWQNAVGHSDYYNRMLGVLRPPVWANWLYDRVDYIYPSYLPQVWAMRIDDNSNRAITQSQYGPRLWLLGNEPERADQSNVAPETAAIFSRLWAEHAKGEWAAPGVLLGLPEAYQWLDAYLEADGAIPNIWHVHMYAWTAHHWDEMLGQFQSWLRANGLDRAIIVSETASWDNTLPAQMDIMDRVRAAIGQGNIIAAMWFSSDYPSWRHTSLYVNGELTELGRHYRGLTPAPTPKLKPMIYLPHLRTA